MSFFVKNIHILLSEASIEKAIQQIETIRDRLIPAAERLVRELTEKGVEIAKTVLMEFDQPAYDSGYLHDNISGETDGTHGTVTAGAYYAMYVEFGTGMPGQGGHDKEGTYTQNGWVYYNEQIDRFVFTTGMEARPFMYTTFRRLEEEAKSNGGKVIAEYLA